MEDIKDIEDLKINESKLIDEKKIKSIIDSLIKETKDIKDLKNIENISKNIHKRYKHFVNKNQLRYVFEKYYTNCNSYNPLLLKYMIKREMRSRSGVLVSTIVLKPDVFSCPKKCSYCPSETDIYGNPTQPKSYLSSEPAMLRALEYNFDVKGQIHDRINCYIKQGNIQSLDSSFSYKMEIILSGGTWESYPYEYRNQVMKEIYWACNTYNNNREVLSIEDEILINEKSQFRVIGLTIETRPDFITKQSIKDYRRWGITRVQIGVQHYDDSILDFIKRECYTSDTINAIKMLKECAFKVVCHLMPDLPGSSPEKDIWMFDNSIFNPLLQFDDVKIYPTAICKSHDPNYIVKSDISDWYNEGSYIPYAEKNLKDLIDVLKYYKVNVQPWVRIQRLVRDIPKKSIEAGYEKISNLRQIIQDEMKKEGKKCNCIRCFEIDDNEPLYPTLVVREYDASYGKEYFISIEDFDYLGLSYIFYLVKYHFFKYFGIYTFWSGNNTRKSIIGFCRLRIDNNPGGGYIKELENCGLIREVHVYGSSLKIGSLLEDKESQHSQHKGYGKLLVSTAEKIILNNGLTKSSIIAGVGTREYYKNKCGYHLEGTYMVKNLYNKNNLLEFFIFTVLLFVFLFIFNPF